jgi:hypothetical protein
MAGLPEVLKSVSSLELAAGNQERLDGPPYVLSISPNLRQEEPSVTDVHVVSPSAQLHGEKLPRPQSSHQE